MTKKTSPRILNTSANLLGFCLIVITSLHITGSSESSLIDEFTSVIALLLALSSVLSFAAIRTVNEKAERKMENLADLLFIIALAGVVLLIVFITVRLWWR